MVPLYIWLIVCNTTIQEKYSYLDGWGIVFIRLGLLLYHATSCGVEKRDFIFILSSLSFHLFLKVTESLSLTLSSTSGRTFSVISQNSTSIKSPDLAYLINANFIIWLRYKLIFFLGYCTNIPFTLFNHLNMNWGLMFRLK